MRLWTQIGVVAAVALPLFNIPLIIRILQRKSSNDISLCWAVGVWVCIVLMTPQALHSSDVAFRLFGIANIIFFSIVAFFVIKYRSRVSVKDSSKATPRECGIRKGEISR